MTDIKDELRLKIESVKEDMQLVEAGTSRHDTLKGLLKDLEESLEDQDREVLNTGSVCTSCEG